MLEKEEIKNRKSHQKPVIAVTMATSRQGIGVVKELCKTNKYRIRAITRNTKTEKALELSKSSEEAYREIIRIFSKNNEIIKLLNSYCNNYFNDFGGGTVGRIATAQTDNHFLKL